MDIRKVAILASRMDAETTELMLADLSSEQRDAIRLAIAEVGEISDEDVQTVAAELQKAVASCEVDDLYADDVLPLSHVRTVESSPILMGTATGHGNEDKLATVLQNSSVESLLRVLQDEYPQTLSAVVSCLQPEEAAKFLAGLADSKRADVMRRLAEMDATDSDILEELSDEIASLVDAELSQVDGSLVGRDAVKAILFAARGEQRNCLITSLSVGDPRLATQLGVGVEPQTEVKQTKLASDRTESTDHDESRGVERWTFERVTTLGSIALANVVRTADFEVVLLALVGASPAQTECFLSGLTSTESSRFRRRLSAVGPVRLRDIEFAQRQLTLVAQRWRQSDEDPATPRSKRLRSKGLTLSV